MTRSPALLIATTVPGTIRTFLLPFAEHFRAKGWRVDALTGPGPDVGMLEPSFDRVWPASWSRRPTDPRNLTLAPLKARRVLADGRYDLVHTHTPVSSLVLRATLGSLGRRRPGVVYTAHGFHFHDRGGRLSNGAWAALERLGARWTDRLVVINERDEAEALRRNLIPRDRLVRLPGIGIDLDHYSPDRVDRSQVADARRQLGLPDDAVLLTMIAEFVPRKNHDAAVRALHRSGDARLHLCLAGTGPERDRVLSLASSLGVRDRVHPVGFLADTRPLVLASAATVLPSYQEGLSRAVLESLAMGVPVIGGRTRGIAELISAETGLVVEPGDVDGLAGAYVRVQELPSGGLLRSRTEAGLQPYSLDGVLRAHEELYSEVLRLRSGIRTAQ